jgi:hypothetical protein
MRMTFSESLEFGKHMSTSPCFKPEPGMSYLLLAEGSGRIHGSGRIESVHPEWGPIDNGAPIDDGWIPDVTDKLTFDLCLGWLLMTVVAKG